MKEKKLYFTLFLSLFVLCLSTIIFAAIPESGEKDIFENTFRLHVIANSDSEKDQEVKLLVRDEIVKFSKELLSNCTDIQTAQSIIEENKKSFEEIAQNTLFKNGFSYTAKIETGYEKYPTRYYGAYTFPSGKYLSLQVKLGESSGKNWWCVLYPPMCLSVAEENMYPEQSKELLKNQKYKVKFKFSQTIKNLFC